MTIISDPVIGFKYGWASGDDGWGADMNANLEWIILLLQRGVISRTTVTPPGSPSVGDAYIIGPSATGDWVGEDNNLAIWWQRPAESAPDWFIIDMTALPEGILAYVQDEDLLVAWDGTSAWTTGADLDRDAALENKLANLDVISDVLTTPPGSPSIGDTYIPAPTATGDWAGHEGKLAIWWQEPGAIAAAWLIISPTSGQRVYIINRSAVYHYYSSAWSSDAIFEAFLSNLYVISDALTTPPGSPSIGDIYIPAATATGDWAGHEDDIAIWWQEPGVAAAWKFKTPTTGMRAYVENKNAVMIWDSNLWFFGIPADITWELKLSRLSVADRDLTTPPGSPSIGDTYIPAATATGDWAGHEDDVAIWWKGPGDSSAAWKFHTPETGLRAYITDEDVLSLWDGTAWTTGLSV